MRLALGTILAGLVSSAHATGSDEFGYFGVTPEGKTIDMLFIAEPNLYGSSRSSRLSFCEAEAHTVTCRSTKNGPATTVYEIGVGNLKESRKASHIYRTHLRAKGSYIGMFLVCKIGCIRSVPRMVLELNWVD